MKYLRFSATNLASYQYYAGHNYGTDKLLADLLDFEGNDATAVGSTCHALLDPYNCGFTHDFITPEDHETCFLAGLPAEFTGRVANTLSGFAGGAFSAVHPGFAGQASAQLLHEVRREALAPIPGTDYVVVLRCEVDAIFGTVGYEHKFKVLPKNSRSKGFRQGFAKYYLRNIQGDIEMLLHGLQCLKYVFWLAKYSTDPLTVQDVTYHSCEHKYPDPGQLQRVQSCVLGLFSVLASEHQLDNFTYEPSTEEIEAAITLW